MAAAAIHGGTEPDLLDEVASWQADDFWQYALYAAVACIRAAAREVPPLPVRAGTPESGNGPSDPPSPMRHFPALPSMHMRPAWGQPRAAWTLLGSLAARE
jgi:hypothetical protein